MENLEVLRDKDDFGIDKDLFSQPEGSMIVSDNAENSYSTANVEVMSLLGSDDGVESGISSEAKTTSGSSLLENVDDAASFVEINNDVMSEKEIEIRKKFFSNPVNQANILFENYMREQQIKLNRQQKRNAYNQFLRNAKKGMYKKIFNEQIYGISKEKADKDFGKLN